MIWNKPPLLIGGTSLFMVGFSSYSLLSFLTGGGTPWKNNGWNLQPSPMKRKENDLNQTSMRTCSMLIFQGCKERYPLLANFHRFRPDRSSCAKVTNSIFIAVQVGQPAQLGGEIPVGFLIGNLREDWGGVGCHPPLYHTIMVKSLGDWTDLFR